MIKLPTCRFVNLSCEVSVGLEVPPYLRPGVLGQCSSGPGGVAPALVSLLLQAALQTHLLGFGFRLPCSRVAD